MLRGSDQHRVNVLILQHAVIVQVRFGVGRDLLDRFQALGIDIGGADALHVLAAYGLPQDLRTAVARPDNSEADTVIRAKDIGRGQCARQPRGQIADKVAARLHGSTPWKQLYTCNRSEAVKFRLKVKPTRGSVADQGSALRFA